MSDIIEKVIKFATDKKTRFSYLTALGLTKWMSDEQFLKKEYYLAMGKPLNLDNPQTFNEKLQWLKIHNRKPEYTTMVDKYAAKQYVADKIGSQYIIPTLGVWDHFDDIDFDALPDQFVLKCTHDSGGLVICKDKSRLDKKAAKRKIEYYLRRKYYYVHREWPYKDVKPRIIAEKYMTNGSSEELSDYKFYCFDGAVEFVMINSDRNSDKPTKADYFDRDFNWLDFTWGYQHAEIRPQKPKEFDEMLEIAEKLAKGLPHIRVDFYDCNGQIYFGELTFFDGSGFDKIEPLEWDYKIGKMLKLPTSLKQ
ncbi:ATP-grasp fold amidoligase family protein [Limosilactobacillus fermentum]|uniref:ATP-grasp fold amidoligase family protein n=2 Tax=Limosilactobacillus fermentum TaxID=1613 RepID=UPI00209BCF91|nr:glycosyl transferase [Limosilactobacillus fermentum]